MMILSCKILRDLNVPAHKPAFAVCDLTQMSCSKNRVYLAKVVTAILDDHGLCVAGLVYHEAIEVLHALQKKSVSKCL